MARSLLLDVFHGLGFVDSGPIVVGISAKSDSQQGQEFVHSDEKTLGSVGQRVDRRCPLEDDDSVGQICRHDEIVLDDEACLLGVQDKPEVNRIKLGYEPHK